jgi:hypothetical protein
MRQSWLLPFSMDCAVTQRCGVAAFEPADEVQFDVAVAGRAEQPPSVTQQYGDEMQFECVEGTAPTSRWWSPGGGGTGGPGHLVVGE